MKSQFNVGDRVLVDLFIPPRKGTVIKTDVHTCALETPRCIVQLDSPNKKVEVSDKNLELVR